MSLTSVQIIFVVESLKGFGWNNVDQRWAGKMSPIATNVLNGHFLIFTLQIFCFCRHIAHLPTSVESASQMVAQHDISIGPIYRVICIMVFLAPMLERHQHNAAVRKESTINLDTVSMTGQRRRLWVNIETALVECHRFVQSIQQTP